ncbi:iron-containing alcohol dehydrogenase [Tessaracoccus coleopterorum]
MSTFTLATEISFGEGALEGLREFADRRVFVVTDSFLAGTDVFALVLDLLGADTVVFDEVLPNPTVAVIGKGVASYLAARPDVVIAYGGGSPIDAAKAMHKAAIEVGLGAVDGLVVIPTTSGSGSEVTSFSVITEETTHAKLPMVSPDLVPRLAILDARAVLGVPRAPPPIPVWMC